MWVKVGPKAMEMMGRRGLGEGGGGGGRAPELLIRHLVLREVAAKQVRGVPGGRAKELSLELGLPGALRR